MTATQRSKYRFFFFPERSNWEYIKMKIAGNEKGNNSFHQVIGPNVCLIVVRIEYIMMQ